MAFNFSAATARAVRSAFGKAAKIEESAAAVRNAAGQRMVDELVMLCDNPDREKFFKNSGARAACMEVFSGCGLSESAVKNYPTSVKLAFIHDVPFSAQLFTREGKVAAGIEDAPAKGESKPKAGKVEKTDVAAAAKTAQKFLAQLRTLKLDPLAADVLDVLTESWSWFKEVDEK